MAVVLGLVLCGDRLATLRSRAALGAELETLLAAARPDGFIGHTIFWDHRLDGRAGLFYNVSIATTR